MRVVLTLAPCFFPSAFKWTPPTSLLYLAAALTRSEVDVEIIDPVLQKWDEQTFIRALIDARPDVVGFSITSDTYFAAAKMIRTIKRHLPQVVTVAGGPHPTLLADNMMASLPEIDIAVKGEAEIIFPELLRRLSEHLPLKGLEGVSFRENGEIATSSVTALVEDLDSLPFPAYPLIDFNAYQFTFPVSNRGEIKAANLITSRGCPFDCQFCSNTNLGQRRVRYRSVDNVIREIEKMADTYGVGFVWIQDDAFNLSRRRVLEFCDALEKSRLGLNWTCIMRADNADRELLGRMKETGFTGGCFAIETIVDRLRQDVIGKKLTRFQIDSTIENFNVLKLWCGINFMVSLPDETRQDMNRNVAYIENLKLAHDMSYAALNITRIYPGTRLEQEARRKGIIESGFSWLDYDAMRRFSPGNVPGLFGTVPIYREALRIKDIFSALFRWKYSVLFRKDPGKGSDLSDYLLLYLRNIRSPREVWALAEIAVAWVQVLARHILRILRGKA